MQTKSLKAQHLETMILHTIIYYLENLLLQSAKQNQESKFCFSIIILLKLLVGSFYLQRSLKDNNLRYTMEVDINLKQDSFSFLYLLLMVKLQTRSFLQLIL